MCNISLSRVLFSKLYNHKFKTKIGFYRPNRRDTNIIADSPEFTNKTRNCILKFLQIHSALDTLKYSSGAKNYGVLVTNDTHKLNVLQQSLEKIFSDNPQHKVCIYAGGFKFKHISQVSQRIQTFPDTRVHQYRAKRCFRKGESILLLSDKVLYKIPNVDIIIHYDLPKSVNSFYGRLKAVKMNIFFYQKHESVLMSQLQNSFNFIVYNWDLPSNGFVVDSFVTELEKVISNIDAKGTYEMDASNYGSQDLLSCLLYMLHYKLRNMKRKQYLLYDPKFKMFESRQCVAKYLKDNGIFNYTGISLTRNGFLVESYNILEIPNAIPLLNHKRLGSHIKNVKRRIERSCISSPFARRLRHKIYPMNFIYRKMYNKLINEEENRIVKRLKCKI